MPISSFSKSTKDVHHHVLKDKDLIAQHTALYMTQALRAFAISLVGIFLPIYIFINSSDYLIFNNDATINGIIWGMAYFFLRSVGTLVSASFLTKHIFGKIHMNRSIVISTIIQIIEVYLWIRAGDNMYIMLFAGLLAGLKVTMFWIPYHTYFVKKFTTGKYGHTAGIRLLTEKVLTGVSPLIGGIIIANFGFNAAFLTSIILLVASGLPIVLTIHEWKHREHTTEGVLKGFLFNKKYLKATTAFVGQAIDAAVYTIAWPILLFIGLASFVKIGILTSITTIIGAVTALFVGKAIDKKGTKVFHGVGVLMNALLHIPRVFAVTPVGLYVIDILDRLNSPLYSLPNISLSYEKATRSKSSTDFMVYREFAIHIGIALITAFIIVALMNASVWRWIFFIGSAGAALVYLLDLDSN